MPAHRMITAVIPTHNRREELSRCLHSLGEFAGEIVVVDNGSRDGTAAWIRERYPRVRLLENDRNLGASQAKNQGAKAASGKVLWFLDSDTVVPEIEVPAAACEILERDPGIGAVGGEIYALPDGVREWRRKVLLANGETETVGLRNGYGEMLQVDYLPSCNLFIRKDVFRDIGGFDPLYFFLVEDLDLCYRLRRKGYRCVVDDRTSVIHEISLRNRAGDLYLLHRNRIRFVLLNLPVRRLILLPVIDIAYQLRPYKLKSLVQGRVSVEKHLPSYLREIRSRSLTIPFKLAAAVAAQGLALAGAYAWNSLHLPQTIGRRGRADFLSATAEPEEPGR